MLVIGVTGSIGMGKSTVASHFFAHGIPVCDADALVHKLYEGAAVPLIEHAFPGVTNNNRVDRIKLAKVLLEDPSRFKVIEEIIHPLVREAQREFLQTHANKGVRMAVLEIPLLFETGANGRVDVAVVASTSSENQKSRVLERPGMTVEKLDAILKRQMPDDKKRALADFVVDTSGPIESARDQVDRIIETLKSHPPHSYQRHWA